MLHQEDERLGEILDMDPREPLQAGPDRSSDQFLEEGNHLTQGSSLFTQYNPESGGHHASPLLSRLEGFVLPFHAQLS